jgi:hypothetical protein
MGASGERPFDVGLDLAEQVGEVAVGVALVAERSSGQPRELAGVAVCERDHDTIRREHEPVDRVGREARLPLLSVGDDR